MKFSDLYFGVGLANMFLFMGICFLLGFLVLPWTESIIKIPFFFGSLGTLYLVPRCGAIAVVMEKYVIIQTFFGCKTIDIADIAYYGLARRTIIPKTYSITLYLSSPFSFYMINDDPTNELFDAIKHHVKLGNFIWWFFKL